MWQQKKKKKTIKKENHHYSPSPVAGDIVSSEGK